MSSERSGIRDVRTRLRRRGVALEAATLGWNVVGVVVLAATGLAASSVALIGFGIDSLIEILASTVVIWELSGAPAARRRPALLLMAIAFVLLAVYLAAQSTVSLITQHHPTFSPAGAGWTAATAVVMFVLAGLKGRTGRALEDPVLVTESRVTSIDALLAATVLMGLMLDALLGWWWADAVAGYVIVFYAGREALAIRSDLRREGTPTLRS